MTNEETPMLEKILASYERIALESWAVHSADIDAMAPARAELASLKAALRAGRDREALLREAMHTVEGIAVGLAITPVHSKSMCLTRGRASELLSELSTKISLAINATPSAEKRSDGTERM